MHGPGALSARRRPRGADEKPVWAIHVTAVDGPVSGAVEYETDRARFLGRGRTPANPAALDTGSRLSGTTGPVLDPVFSLRRRVRLAPGGTARVAFVTGAAETREAATALAEHFRELDAADRAFDRARESGRKELRELGLTPDDIAIFNRLAGAVVFTGPALRRPDAVAANRLGQPGLWRHAISGDRPIVLALVATAGDEPLVHQLVRWHAYARRRGLDLDLVILDERSGDAVARLKADLQAGRGPLARQARRGVQPGHSKRPQGRCRAPCRRGPGGPRRRPRHAGRPAPARVGTDFATAAAVRDRPIRHSGNRAPGGRSARGPVVLERPRRLYAGRPRVRDHDRRHDPRRSGPAAGPVGQRARQPRLRLPGDGGRPGLLLGGQQPAEPPDPLEQRPGLRPARRGGLPARRGERRGLVADAAAGRRRVGGVRSPRSGLHLLRPPQPRAGAGTAGVGAARRPGQAGAPERAQ